MVIRLHRSLSDQDKQRFNDLLAPYIKQSSGQYLYKLERSEIPHELEKLSQLYHRLYEALKDSYRDVEVFGIFERVYNEHFTVVDDKVEVKPSRELSGSTLQSPDGIDATYRQKNGQHYHRQSVNVAETANPTLRSSIAPTLQSTSPEDEVNFITDVAVCSSDQMTARYLSSVSNSLKIRHGPGRITHRWCLWKPSRSNYSRHQLWLV